MKDRFLIFLNPTAGSGRAGLFYPQMQGILKIKNIDYCILVTKKKGDIKRFSHSYKNSIKNDFTRIIAVGGDGTTWETLSSLFECNITNIPIAIFPFGSGNDLARSLNIPLYNPRKALDVAMNGIIDRLDICSVNDYYFANYLSFGFEGEVVTRREIEGTTLPGFTSYLKPFLKTIETLKYHLYHLKFPEKEVDIIGLNCIISNIPSHYGGLQLVEEAKYNDGIFEITVIKKIPSVKTFAKLPFFRKNPMAQSEFARFRTDKVTLCFDEYVPPVQIDGEPFKKLSKKFKIEINQGALPIIKRSK